MLYLLCLGEAVFARCLSSLKDERVQASKQLPGPGAVKFEGNKTEFVEHIRKVSGFDGLCHAISSMYR